MLSQSVPPPCRICQSTSLLFYRDHRAFFLCPICLLIFITDVPEKHVEEKHYRSQWETTEPGFWKDQADGILRYIEKHKVPERILDFGAGSGELTAELKRRGYDATALEPMRDGFLKDQHYPHPFDVVIAVEVIEHLADVWEELRQIEQVLAQGGLILFSTGMTNPFIESPDAVEHFKKWWYKDDPTHLNFFCNRTLNKIAELGPYDIDVYEDQVFVLRKRPSS